MLSLGVSPPSGVSCSSLGCDLLGPNPVTKRHRVYTISRASRESCRIVHHGKVNHGVASFALALSWPAVSPSPQSGSQARKRQLARQGCTREETAAAAVSRPGTG